MWYWIVIGVLVPLAAIGAFTVGVLGMLLLGQPDMEQLQSHYNSGQDA